MSKLTLNWFGSTRDFTLKSEQNGQAIYQSRTDSDIATIRVQHVPLKAKAPTGAAVVRHEVSLTWNFFATPTALEQTAVYNFNFTVADSIAAVTALAFGDVIAAIAASDSYMTEMLNSAPLPTT